MDKITIRGLACYAHHGVMPEERALGQKFIINCSLELDLSEAALADDLSRTVNYAQVAALIKEHTESRTYDLIETLAENLARLILRSFSPVRALELEVQKPSAPVGIPLDTVAVTVRRSRHRAYIALGSNIGDRRSHFDNALRALDQNPDIRVTKVSSFIETEPYGGVEQENFLNGMLCAETVMSPMELLGYLNKIEADEGRERLVHWGPRTLDLDLILYDDLTMDTDVLTIPHREMHLRDFVLEPLVEIAPAALHPVFRKTASQLLAELKDQR